jgi:thioredoxin reductase
MKKNNYDVIIVGGSYAGLAAAMSLGRAIRKVLVIDSGKPCNLPTPHSHNFLTQDGNRPAAIAAIGKAQVMAYPTVEFLDDHVDAVEGMDYEYLVHTASMKKIKAKKILFATGIRDLIPAIPGFAESWGKSVIHCPYCHGYEYRGRPTGVLGNGDNSFEYARMISNWTKELTVFTNGQSTISEQYRQELVAMKIAVIEEPLSRIEHKDGYINKLFFANGESRELEALYSKLPFEQHSKAPEQLGCALNEGGYLKVDEMQKTSVAGVYAAGDNSLPFRSVAGAVAAGSKAGAVINLELVVGKR